MFRNCLMLIWSADIRVLVTSSLPLPTAQQGLGIFLFITASRPALGPTQPPIQWIPGAPSLGVKRPGREADHSHPSSAEVKGCVEPYLHSLIRLNCVVPNFKKASYYLKVSVIPTLGVRRNNASDVRQPAFLIWDEQFKVNRTVVMKSALNEQLQWASLFIGIRGLEHRTVRHVYHSWTEYACGFLKFASLGV
jgi:hypothetical protein